MIEGLSGVFAGNEFSFQSADLQPIMKRRQEYPLTYRLQKEQEYLGMYLSGHPVTQYRQVRQQQHTQRIMDLKPGSSVKLLVLLNQIRQINTKKTHQPMAFATASDETGSMDITIFPRQYQRFVDALKPTTIVMIEGSVEQRNERLQVIANQIIPVERLLNNQRQVSHQRWVIRVSDNSSVDELLPKMLALTKSLHGNTPVVIYNVAAQQATTLPRQQWVGQQDKVRDALNKVFGSNNVVLQTFDK